MQLIAVSIHYTAYVLVDNDPNEALQVVQAAILNPEDPLTPTDSYTLEARTEKDIAGEALEQAPWVAGSVTDEAFAAITKGGETTKDILHALKG